MICDDCGDDVEPTDYARNDGLCCNCQDALIELQKTELMTEREYIDHVRSLKDESEINLYLMETQGHA